MEEQSAGAAGNTAGNATDSGNINGDPQKEAESKHYSDFDGNELKPGEKRLYGFLLVIFTILPAYFIILFWPDKLPDPKEDIAPLYICDPFDVRLACLPDTCCPECFETVVKTHPVTTLPSAAPTASAPSTTATPSPETTASSTTTAAPTSTGTTATNTTSPATTSSPVTTATSSNSNTAAVNTVFYKRKDLIHINTLLLILVALGGFLGNMIHVATSFTTFVGAGKFKKSWLLWYCIKPFTASALAIGIYFVFRGGFLNMSDGGASINLYGLMTVSLFAGLFTDKATEKLKEVFEVLFRSKEERPDPLVSKFKITNLSPLIIERGKLNKMTLTGEKLDTEKLKIYVNNEEIKDIKPSAGTITFEYKVPEELKDKKTLTVSVKDDKGKEQYTVDLTVKDPTAPVLPGDSKRNGDDGGEDKEPEAGEGNADADPSDSNDDNDDADETSANGEPIIKG